MLNKKYFLLVISILSLFTSMCMINETYAKYVTSTTSTTSSSIARWKILVNNDDITLGATSTNLISPIFPGTNDIAADVIAPNATGYFDIVLDASDVDVSFRYTITIAPKTGSAVTELVATSYAMDGGSTVTFTGTPQITETIALNAADKTRNIRVFVKWDDNLNQMTNAQDTDATKNNQKGMMDVSINVVQV